MKNLLNILPNMKQRITIFILTQFSSTDFQILKLPYIAKGLTSSILVFNWKCDKHQWNW